LAAASPAPCLFDLSIEHPAAQTAGKPILRLARNQKAPKISVLGALALSAFTRRGDDWMAHVAIRNDGGAVSPKEAQLRIPALRYQGPRSPVQLELLPGGLLAAGETSSIPVRLNEDVYRRLRTNVGLARGARVMLDSIEVPLLMVQGGAPGVELHIRDTGEAETPFAGRGLSGRRARIGVALENQSAEYVRVTTVALRLRGGAWVSVKTPPGWLRGIEPGRIMAGELRPYLTAEGAEPLPAGAIEIEARVLARTADSGVEIESLAAFSLEVVTPAPFIGRVAIDLGTTETAAALSKGRQDPNLPPFRTPIVLELGPIGLTAEQTARLSPHGERADITDPIHPVRFLETTLALDSEGNWSVGEDIPEPPYAPEPLLFSRFKWLADEDPPARPLRSVEAILEARRAGERKIGDRVDPKLLLGAFLNKVRELIEEHPEVAALCGASRQEAGESSCRIYATRPVTMGPRMEQAFIEGLSQAGLKQISASRLADVLIPESWPPSLMVTEGRDAVFAPLTLSGAGIFREPVRDGPALARLLVVDVGGGSADLSAIGIQVERLRTTVSILGNDMSRSFAGDGFAQVIGQVLRGFLQKDRTWPDDAPPEVRAEFRQTVKWLQHSDGPLQALTNAGVLFENESGSVAEVEARIREALGDPARAVAAETLFGARPHAEHVRIELDEFPRLAAQLERRFNGDYKDHLGEKIDALKPYLEGGPENIELRLVISGRGAACPLAETLIRRVAEQKLAIKGEPIFLTPPASKSITSWGALRLVDHLASVRGHVLKHPDEMEGFSVLAGADNSQRLILEPMTCREIWFYRTDRGLARTVGERREFGPPIAVESVALIRADRVIQPRLRQALVYSGRSDGDWTPTREARLDLLEAPLERQWIYLRRRDHDLIKAIALAESEEAALDVILGDVQ
jgi:hypothetical protein